MNLFDPLQEGEWLRRFGEELGATLWGGTLYELAPGAASPYHWHYGEEEFLLVVEGAPTLRTPAGEQPLRPWDLAVFPRGEAGAHQVRNDTDRPARLAFFSSVSDPEVAVYPDDDRVGVNAGWSRPDAVPHTRGYLERP
ncbi:MAG TPA: cupin domain-containing protein [Gaiellaceae bacterium]|nr:cupin domain-containing protein [Gaiellaceae bacterium]